MIPSRIFSCFLGHSKTYFPVKRSLSQGSGVSFLGRDFINPQDFTCKELKSLLWTATDLKHNFKEKKIKAMDLLQNHNATILLNAPHLKVQVAVTNAIRLLGATVNVIVDKRWETLASVCDGGRCLSGMTDIIIAKSEQHESMQHLRDGSSVPVINYGCGTFKPLQVLADLLTLQERYGHLKGLKLGWVGPPEGLFNTYVVMCPRMGMNIQFTCSCVPDFPTSPAMFDVAAKNCIQHNTEIAEFTTAEEAIYRVDVIATTLHEKSNMHINREMVREAAVNWTFLHDLPRSKVEVSDDVFYSPNSKVWESSSNMTWVTMAVVLHLLKDYQQSIEMPNFDGE
ncbi:ornithine transcarbamylase, mitochondrial isoform X2 [Anabrus simplex]|uniref:ornithine transcarbamylase, mitochondrial isoform X2 n=1 Tax=Anabrus simplex TaxID=316456 RepID=UPI0035A38667